MRDAAAAYQTALLWKLTDDEAYAKKSIEIMNAWANKCKKIASNDANQVLAAGAQGYTFACAAEMMLGYEGWNAGDLLDDPLGSGEKLAQDQESGRDQGHAQTSAMVTANLAQMAYSLYEQNKLNADAAKLDFFGANDNALLKLGEYVALSNLRNGTDNANKEGQWLVSQTNMPFNKLEYCINCTCKDKNHSATHTVLADDSGRGSVRPGWEIYYNHYAKVKGLTSGFIYVKQMADKLRPECGPGDDRYGSNSGAFDQLGWSTLMLYR